MTFTWTIPPTEAPITGIDWQSFLDSGRSIDPYLAWANLTGFAGHDFVRQSGSKLPVLIELDKDDYEVPRDDRQYRPNCSACDPVFGQMEIPAAYKTVSDEAATTANLLSAYVTARVLPTALKYILGSHTPVARLQLGIPRIPTSEVAAPLRGKSVGRKSVVVIGIIDDAFGFAHSQFLDEHGHVRTAFLWDQSRNMHPSRMQTQPYRPGWRNVQEFGYGAELYVESIAAVADAIKANPSPAGTYAAYARSDYVPHAPDPDSHSTSVEQSKVPPGTMLERSHGTAVAHLAAGREVPRLEVFQGRSAPSAYRTDAAGSSPLILVQLPTRTTLDTSGGSLGVHVLDGLRYIVSRAGNIVDADLTKSKPRPGTSPLPNDVVVNISYGAIAGPHDGTSILECAIKAFVQQGPAQHPRTWVVLAAGNAHRSRTHSRLSLVEGGDPKTLIWTVGPDNALESYLEIWLPEETDDPRPSPLGQGCEAMFCLQIQPPGSRPVLQLNAGCAHLMYRTDAPSRGPVAGAFFSRRVAQGKKGTMVLLAVGRTARQLSPGGEKSAPPAPHGEWRVDIAFNPAHSAKSVRPVVVHAWSERNDQLWGNVRPQQATLVGDEPTPEPTEFSPQAWEYCHRNPPVFTNDVPRPFLPDTTFSSLSGVDTLDDPSAAGSRGGGVIVVGGYRLADGEMAPYSGAGPARGSGPDRGPEAGTQCNAPAPAEDGVRMAPDLDAPSDIGIATRGLRTHGLFDGTTYRISGTSAAAPLVTRMLAGALQTRTNPPTSPAQPQPISERPLSRATPTPTSDDRFRKGKLRLKL